MISVAKLAKNQEDEPSHWLSMMEELKRELDSSHKALGEIKLLLEQSGSEVTKLAQKSATANAHLQRVKTQFESLPREDIRSAYDSALDSQQRLFVMRGQLEKLQSDQEHIQRYTNLMERVFSALQELKPPENQPAKNSAMVETVEMLIKAQETERQRLSRQMHDGPAQALSNFILQTEIAMRLFEMDKARAQQELSDLKNSATSAFQQVRDFIFDLRPMMLDDLGLVPTIKRYTAAFQEKFGMVVETTITGTERRFESYLEVMVFRAVQELLNTAVSQRQATQFSVRVDIREGSMQVIVEDNGVSFDLTDLENEGGIGSKMIKDRVEMLGGSFEIDTQPNHGTRVRFEIPTDNLAA
jgi:two-component system sensor histidine kinase DegS